jgi:DNA-binding CsgD family transcriptional regulator
MTTGTIIAAGSEAAAVALYRQLRHGRAGTVSQAADLLGLDSDQTVRACAELRQLGLVTQPDADPTDLVHIGPEVALVRLLVDGVRELDRYHGVLADTQDAVSRLVGHYLPLSPGSHSEAVSEEMADDRRIAAYIDSAMAMTHSEVLTMDPSPVRYGETLAHEIACSAARPNRSVRLRTIVPSRLAANPQAAAGLEDLADAGFRIRAADVVPLRMGVFDRRRAVLCLDAGDGTSRTVSVEGDAVCQALAAFHDYCWQQAQSRNTPPTTAENAGSLTDQERSVVRMLAVGLKDEKIARSLGVSLRTVTRIVCELSQRVGADSRFQAGVQAARMGWVD